MALAVRHVVSLSGTQNDVAHALRRGLEQDSFVLLTNHGIDDALYREAQASAAGFFAQPIAEKLKTDIRTSSAHRGYVPQAEAGDYADEGGIRRYEAFDVGRDLSVNHPLVRANTPLLGPNVWPDDQTFKQATTDLYSANVRASSRVFELLELAYDMRPGTFQQYRTQPLSQMRYLNYFDRPADAGAHVAMGAHTDYEFMTLIKQFSPGLEVKLRDGSWHRTDVPHGCVVVLAGDLLETITNGRIQSALHRVPDIDGPRFSIPFFAGADYSAIVSPAPGMTPDDGIEREPVCAGPHLLAQLRRDFPYMRDRYPMPEVIDLRTGHTNTDVSRSSVFEQRQLAVGS